MSDLRFAVVVRTEDGEHVRIVRTVADAILAFEEQAGRKLSGDECRAIEDGGTVRAVDDWGRVIRVSPAPLGITTAAQMEAYRRAYDAREMGTLTAAQRHILARVEG